MREFGLSNNTAGSVDETTETLWTERLSIFLYELGLIPTLILGALGCLVVALVIGGVSAHLSGSTPEAALRLTTMSAAIAVAIVVPVLAAVSRLIERYVDTRRRLAEEIERRGMAERRLCRLATTDQLTGLNNRMTLVEKARETATLARRRGSPLALVQIDVDHLQHVNDSIGHAAGDELLRRLGNMLRREIRQSDFAARIGGDEFVILMPQTDDAAALTGAERIRDAVGQIQHGRGAITIGIGIAVADGETATLEDLFARADEALNAAKRAGDHQLCTSLPDGSLRLESRSREGSDADLRSA